MVKQKIAIDVDDVLAQHIPAFIEFSNKNYGTSLEIEDYVGHWAELWNIEWAEIEKRAQRFHHEKAHSFEKFTEADEVLFSLKKEYELVVVTARPSYLIPATHKWLDEFYRGIFSETHFVPIWEPGNKLTKADICKQIGADYLIDDLVRHCNVAAEGGVTALLFGNYNRSKSEHTHPDVVPVKDWKSVGEYFAKRA